MNAFCRNATDSQLQNILLDEARRFARFNGEGDVAESAKELYFAAREECARRGMDADAILYDASVKPL